MREFLQNNLHLQGKVLVPPCSINYREHKGVIKATGLQYIFWSSMLCCGQVDNPSMRWQMALYKEMAGKAEDADAPVKVVKRVQEVSAVLYHLEVVRECVSSGKTEKRWACLKYSSGYYSCHVLLVRLGSYGHLRRSIHLNQRRWSGTNCCPSRDAELLSPVSGWRHYTTYQGKITVKTYMHSTVVKPLSCK